MSFLSFAPPKADKGKTMKLFAMNVRISALPSHPDARIYASTSLANGLIFANDTTEAEAIMEQHLLSYHWKIVEILTIQESHPSLAQGHEHLERMLAQALQYRAGIEIFPSAFDSDPGQPN